ncbi:MAG: S41 family peptidase, partial [Pirellulaceae bacterium]|nr:S41 family peptidase [Pirellulaceae bacterium]
LYSQADLQRKIVEVADKANYYLDIPQTLTTLEYQCGMVHSLDKYSSFLSPNQFRDLYSQIEGNFVGLGIELKIEPGQLKVVQVLDKSPAREQGIVPGDSILAVNGQSVEKLTGNVAANMLRGKPGTTIQLTLQKSDRRQYSLTLSRKQIDVPSVTDAKFLNKDRGIAYLRLPVFQKNTSEELEKSMWELYHQGMKSLVLDLRGNPGGLLDISIETADKFIENGTIVATKGRSPGETFDYQAHRIGTWRVPLVVLIDRNTASASEIFAGAIKDHNRGWVIGEKSYGKGSVQGIFPLTGMQSGLRLTTAKFYSPSGKAISNTGIAPGITVHTTYKPSTDGKEILEQDPVILAAIRTLSQAQERAQQQSGSVTSSLN